MAIKDNDSAKYYNIGKLYDNDGAKYYPIGKVYDNDGEKYYPIYTAQYDLVPNTEGALHNETSADYWHSSADDPVWLDNGRLRIYLASSATTVKCLKPVDLTSYKYMVFTITSVGGSGEFAVGFSAYTGNNGTWAKSVSKLTTTGTHSLKIEDLSGDHYFMVRGDHQPGIVFSEIYLTDYEVET